MKQTHTRDASERKDKVTSIRLSEEQQKKIQENAKNAGMSVSNYIVTAAVNGGSKLDPQLVVKLQNIANDICSVAVMSAPTKAKKIQQEVNEIWQKLM